MISKLLPQFGQEAADQLFRSRLAAHSENIAGYLHCKRKYTVVTTRFSVSSYVAFCDMYNTIGVKLAMHNIYDA